jgi:hypothetical protein
LLQAEGSLTASEIVFASDYYSHGEFFGEPDKIDTDYYAASEYQDYQRPYKSDAYYPGGECRKKQADIGL